MPTLKAILFDLDDTLLDWSEVREDWLSFELKFLQRAFDHIRRATGLAASLETFVEDFRRRTRDGWNHGRSSLVAPHLGNILLQTAEALGAPPGSLDGRALLEAYGWQAVPGCRTFPEVHQALLELQRTGLRFGIVTNAYQPMWMRDIEMEQHGLLRFFPECRISAADIGHLKPHPAIFRAALECLGLEPASVVFVGDNPTADIAGAQAAGLQAVLRITLPMPPLLSGLIVPDAAINSLDELPAVLDNWYPGWRA